MTKPVTPEIEISALEAARRFYVKLHPIEKPDTVRSLPFIFWFFLLITVASAALAALRTGPVFYDSAHQTVSPAVAYVEAFLAVIVVDAAAAGLAYNLVKYRAKSGKAHNLGRVIFLTLIFCVVIQIGANLYAVVGPVMMSTGGHQTAELVISVLVGLAAPIVAFISADGLSVINLEHNDQLHQQKAEYERKVQSLFNDFERWYDAKQRREWIARVQVDGVEVSPIQITKPSVPALPSGPSMSVTDSGQTDNRQTQGNNAPRKSNAQDMVFAYLDSNPDSARLPARTLAQLVGVGHDSANKYRNEWTSQNKS